MKAIILAAGSGTRLGKYTKDLPKGMLEFAGKSLIQRQIETLRSSGLKDIIIVRGFQADKINFLGVKHYDNEEYANTNMVTSLFCAEKELNGDILVCYSDILYEKRVVKQILESNFDIGVTVDDSYWDYWNARLDNPKEDIESLVIKDGRIIELGNPNCELDKAKSRYVGLIKFSYFGTETLKKIFHENKEKYWGKDQQWLNSKSFKKAYMTDMLQDLINKGYKVNPIMISHGWVEFDTVEDYEKTSKWLKEGQLDKFYSLHK